MNIDILVAIGNNRRVIAKKEEEAQARLYEKKAREKHIQSWQPILQRVAKCIPPELEHILTTPEHPASRRNGVNNIDAPFTIIIPTTNIHVKCDPETRWRMEDVPVFRPMYPVPYWDDDNNIGVSWQECGQWDVDFLIALAEAAEKAEELPAVLNECETQAAELREKMNAPKPEPATAPTPAQDETDWLNEAIRYAGNYEYASVAALISIAQELRRLNDREQMSNHTGPWLVDKDLSTLLDKAMR